MLKKLQVRFVLMAMSVVLTVLAVIIAGINILNYGSVVREADAVLELLSENEGTFPTGGKMKDHRLPPGMSPEVPYESRFFTVILDSDSGRATMIDTSQIIAVDTRQAESYAQEILRSGKTRGFVDAYRYIRTEDENVTRVIFLDCGRNLMSFRNFLLTSIGIALAGFLLVFLITAFFSNRIVRPISESYEKQKRFITDAGHEIKTPLTIINANTDVLEQDIGESEWLEDIRRQCRRLTDLTNDLVLLARMEEANSGVPMVEFPVSDMVEETACSFHALAQTQNKVFEIHVQPMLSMKGDTKSIQKLVSILLDNALKYSPEGGTIALTLEQQGKCLRLHICNTVSEPVLAEDLDKLFDRFYRTDPSRSSETGGYGIGLSVARAIVLAHGGKIQASMQDGQTLRMSVQLPV